jgi:hypothetical protein
MSLLAVIPDVAPAAGFDEPSPAATGGGSLGIFVTTNSGPGIRLVQALPERILVHYFPRSPAHAPAAPESWQAADYVGQYRSNRRSYTRFEKVISLPAVATVGATDDGKLVLALGPESARFVPIGTDLFQQETGDPRIAFLRDESGRVTQMVAEFGSFERIGFFASLPWLLLIVVIGTLVCIGIVVGAVVRRWDPAQSNAARLSAQIVLVAAISWILFLLLAVLWAAPMLGPWGQDQFVYNYPQPMLKAALVVLLVVAGLAVATVGTLVPVWRETTWTRWRRLRHTLAALVLVALIASLWQWNLVGLRYY